MTSSTITIPGINHRTAAKLISHGIRTRSELAALCHDHRASAALAAQTGLTQSEICRLAHRAELLGISGIDERHLRLLIESGVTSVAELAGFQCHELLQRIQRSDETRTSGLSLSVMTTLGWIAEARLNTASIAA